MHVKIVRHLEDEQGVSSSRGSLEEKVVPSEHHLFECYEACYKKVSVKNTSEFHERMSRIEVVRTITEIALAEMGGKEPDGPFEFIQIKVIVKEDDEKFVDETLIARNCILYLMNNEGKTIDSMVCR